MVKASGSGSVAQLPNLCRMNIIKKCYSKIESEDREVTKLHKRQSLRLRGNGYVVKEKLP